MLEMGKLEIFRPMSGGNMHKACPLIGGYIICQQYRHIMTIAFCGHWMGCNSPGHFRPFKLFYILGGQNTGLGKNILTQRIGQTDNIAYFGQRPFLDLGYFQRAIINICPASHRPVTRHRPGGGCPDDKRCPVQPLNRALFQGKTCKNGHRCVV